MRKDILCSGRGPCANEGYRIWVEVRSSIVGHSAGVLYADGSAGKS